MARNVMKQIAKTLTPSSINLNKTILLLTYNILLVSMLVLSPAAAYR